MFNMFSLWFGALVRTFQSRSQPHFGKSRASATTHRSVEKIQTVVGEPHAKQHSTQKPTVSIEAYDYFLRGRGYRKQKELELAVEMFGKAVDLDPAFAAAHAALANVCAMQFEVAGTQCR